MGAAFVNDGKFLACPGNFQPSPFGGFSSGHAVPVFLRRQKCRNGAHKAWCNLCRMTMFVDGDFWKVCGLTAEQILTLYPMGAVDGNGQAITRESR